MEEILIYLDYSGNYKAKHQNEIQSAYFGNKFFSLFKACAYYRNSKLPIAITTEESDKSRVTSLSSVNKVITHSLEKSASKSELCILSAMGVPRNFDHNMFLAFLRICTQILTSSGNTTSPTTGKARWTGSVVQ